MTQEAKHTPGPWRIERPEDELLHAGCHVIGGKPCTSIWANGEHSKQGFYHEIALVQHDDYANARLIAAAPELLEALELAKEWISEETPSKAIAKIDIAISNAKATGEAVV